MFKQSSTYKRKIKIPRPGPPRLTGEPLERLFSFSSAEDIFSLVLTTKSWNNIIRPYYDLALEVLESINAGTHRNIYYSTYRQRVDALELSGANPQLFQWVLLAVFAKDNNLQKYEMMSWVNNKHIKMDTIDVFQLGQRLREYYDE